MDRISVGCRNGHEWIEVQGFTLRSEDELLAMMEQDPEPPSEARVQRAKTKAGKWLVDVGARRGSDHMRGPRRLAADGLRRPPTNDGKVPLDCTICQATVARSGVGLSKLQLALGDIWAAGESSPTLFEVAAVIEARSTQRRP
ncbi:MAG: hypothetical protein JWP74_1532 [Marmoricola sp.]|nr:hypothetical protein [Marmoricola sp.]